MPTDSDVYASPVSPVAPVLPTNPFSNLPVGGTTMFSGLDPKDTVAGSGKFADETPITNIKDLDPVTLGVIAFNAAHSSSAGPMTPQQYLDARGGLYANGFGDNRASEQLSKSEMAGLDGSADSYNAAKATKLKASWTANPNDISNPTLKSAVLSGRISASEAADLYNKHWGDNSDPNAWVNTLLTTKKFASDVTARDAMIAQMKAKGYTQSMIDSQVRASYPNLIDASGKMLTADEGVAAGGSGAATGAPGAAGSASGGTGAASGGYDAQGNYVGVAGGYDASGKAVGTGSTVATAVQQNAISNLTDTFNKYGLNTLAPKITEFVKAGYSSDTISLLLQQTPEYQQRFIGNQARGKAGLPILSPAQYLSTEESYKQAMQSAGLPAGFYDNPDDFAKFIGNDVSPSEFNSRLQAAQKSIANTDPAYAQALQQQYGLTTGDMVAYVLDPSKALPLVQQRAQAVQIGEAANASGFTGTTHSFEQQAQDAAFQNLNEQQLRQGYQQASIVNTDQTRLAALQGGTFDQGDAVNEAFKNDASATLRSQRRAQVELGNFRGSVASNVGSLGQDSGGQY